MRIFAASTARRLASVEPCAVARAPRGGRRSIGSGLRLLPVFAFFVAAPLLAQEPALDGFSSASSARQRALETRLIDAIQPELLDSLARELTLTGEFRIAGTPGAAASRDWVTGLTASWGLETEVSEYTVFLPWPTEVELEMTAPVRTVFQLREPVLAEDPTSERPQFPWVNGYSGAGEVEAEVVYVNYGLHEDYEALAARGMSVEGKIAIARYGNSFRGIKALLAEEHGAVGLIMYSDPFDDGYFRGTTYPEGAWRHPASAQRGSVMNGVGDPTTPGWASTRDARRIEPGTVEGTEIPTIPVIPVSAEVAEPILRSLRGEKLPDQGWQGALPFRYHVGPGPTRVRLKVADDRETNGYKEIWNTLAWVRGSERPDEWVVIGAHRDTWGAGASDNGSGTASVLAAARAVAELARDGIRPRRTLVFATWDAEEWGIIGSTEWVEELADELGARAVAYLNQDGVAGGPYFNAGASPSLKPLIREAARVVPSPQGGSIYARWREARGVGVGQDVPLGNLGGGSDYVGFYNHLGIPSAGWGFGGGGSQYHGGYDSYAWMTRFGDPDFEYHTATARMTAVIALRLANAELLPYDYGEFARELRGEVNRLVIEAGERRLGDVGLAELDAAFKEMAEAAAALETVAAAYLEARAAANGSRANGFRAAPTVDADAVDEVNARLLRVERELTRPEGLAGRSWYRNLIYASDDRDGYATIALPGIAEAIRDGARDQARAESLDLARRVRAATAHIRAAAEALGG